MSKISDNDYIKYYMYLHYYAEDLKKRVQR